MPGCSWKTWLLLAVLTVRGSASLPRRPLAFGEAVELGVAVYNSQAGEDARYRLLEAVPQPEWVRTPRRRPTVTFRLSFPRGWVEENLTSLWEAAVRKNRGEKKRGPPVMVSSRGGLKGGSWVVHQDDGCGIQNLQGGSALEPPSRAPRRESGRRFGSTGDLEARKLGERSGKGPQRSSSPTPGSIRRP